MEKLIKEIYDLKKDIALKKEEINAIQAIVNALEESLSGLEQELLEKMIAQDSKEIKVDDLVASYFCKNEFSYGDEKALLNYLIDNGMTDYLTTKHTTSINKTALKKDLKANQELKESLKDYVGDRKVEYVVVTDEEKHQRMLEHIEQGKK